MSRRVKVQPVGSNSPGAVELAKAEARRTRRHRLPKGWRNCGGNESAACQHRDLFVCPDCQAKHADRLVEVYGVHYWCETDAERDELLAMMAED